MLEEKRYNTKHKIIMDKRERLSVTGMLELISFDEDSIVAETEMGTLIVRGSELHVNSLNLEKGELDIDGEIESLVYEDDAGARGKSLLGKIFK